MRALPPPGTTRAGVRARLALRPVMKIGPDRKMPVAGIADRRQLAFGEIARQDRAAFRPEMRIALGQRGIGRNEGVGRRADQIVEDEVRPRRLDFGDQPRDVGLAERQIALAQHLAAGIGDQVARDAVGLPAPDVVRSRQEAVRAEARHDVAEQRHQMLVRAGMHVDDMLVGLETLVRTGIPQRAAGLLEDRNDLLAAPRGDAADDVRAPSCCAGCPRIRRRSDRCCLGIALDRHQLDRALGIGVDRRRSPRSRRRGRIPRPAGSCRIWSRGCRSRYAVSRGPPK